MRSDLTTVPFHTQRAFTQDAQNASLILLARIRCNEHAKLAEAEDAPTPIRNVSMSRRPVARQKKSYPSLPQHQLTCIAVLATSLDILGNFQDGTEVS